MNKLTSQVAIVTGAASGLGMVIAHKLLNDGVRVALFDHNKSALLSAFVGDPDREMLVPIDFGNPELVQDAVNLTIQRFGKINILINANCVDSITRSQSHETAITDLQKAINMHFMSCFLMSSAILPHMLSEHYGRILHVCARCEEELGGDLLATAASRAAVIGMTKVQGREYSGTGVTINSLLTSLHGSVPSETERIPGDGSAHDLIISSFDEAANMAALIVSPDSSFASGLVLDPSGGEAEY